MKRWKEDAFRLEGDKSPSFKCAVFWLECPLIAALAVIFLLPTAASIQTPEVTFIPSQISINSSFLMLADPQALPSESVSVSWIIPGIEPPWYGSFPKAGSRWACYFSSTDPQSTCGANRFPYPSYGTPYTVLVDAVNQYSHVENISINLNVGGIPITSQIDVVGANVYMKAWAGASISGAISYKAYYADTLEEVPGKSGPMIYSPNIFGYTYNTTLQNGQYYIAFTASSSTDSGGGLSKVTVGGSGPVTNQTLVSVERIIYSPVITAGQTFTLRRFKITNTGTESLTALSISVPAESSGYLTITPESTTLLPNQSTLMAVTLKSIQSSINLSIYATLYSGSSQLAQIPVDLWVSVIGSVDPASCAGKTDGADCLGGICCGEVCRKKAECCNSFDCGAGETCTTGYKCSTSVTPGVCEGKNDSTPCTGGYCCSGSCEKCCVDDDCSIGETCSFNTCEPEQTDECQRDADCPGEFCCSGKCKECCLDDDCDTGDKCCGGSCSECCDDIDCPAGTSCSLGSCDGGGGGGGPDVVTIALIGGGVAAAAAAGFFLFKKFRKRGKGDEEIEEGGEGEEEFSDEDFY